MLGRVAGNEGKGRTTTEEVGGWMESALVLLSSHSLGCRSVTVIGRTRVCHP